MKIYLVGGAVRDQLLGRPVTERDWVVVGATPDTMRQLGYQQVGKEFPVFLHPETREEYALARVERKIDQGYKGFSVDTSPSVTLEEDLKRRDLTINAIAMDETAHHLLIDPYGGQHDLATRTLRHVSDAFAEDPVRILRVGRFLARYHELGFSVHPSTTALMQQMVQAGEVDALVAERVFKELDRALTEPNPEQFFHVLDTCGALATLFPGITMTGYGMRALKACRQKTALAPVCFAALLHATTPPASKASPRLAATICKRYRVPNYYQKLALATERLAPLFLNAERFSAEFLLDAYYALDIFRAPTLFQEFLLALHGISEAHEKDLPIEVIRNAALCVKNTPIAAIVSTSSDGKIIHERIRAARLQTLEEFLHA